MRLTAEAQLFCATRLPFLGLNPVFGAPLPYQSWLRRSNQTIWNAIAGGTLIGSVAPTPIRELPKDHEQDELHEFGRWTRADIPIGAGHRSFQMSCFYGPPKGDFIRKNYADELLKLLFECSKDFGTQMPAAICCDLNRNPDECAYLRIAMARTGWTDIGQLQHGEADAPPHLLS